MATPVTTLEILRYCELRQMGYTVRDAAKKVGRPRTSLHRYDPFKQPKPKAIVLEEAIAGPIEEAIDEALSEAPSKSQFSASQIVDLHPTLRDRIRSLANTVKGIIERFRKSA